MYSDECFHTLQLLSKTIRGSLKLVEEPRKESGEVDDVEDSSQQSAIVSADRDGEVSSSQVWNNQYYFSI